MADPSLVRSPAWRQGRPAARARRPVQRPAHPRCPRRCPAGHPRGTCPSHPRRRSDNGGPASTDGTGRELPGREEASVASVRRLRAHAGQSEPSEGRGGGLAYAAVASQSATCRANCSRSVGSLRRVKTTRSSTSAYSWTRTLRKPTARRIRSASSGASTPWRPRSLTASALSRGGPHPSAAQTAGAGLGPHRPRRRLSANSR